MSEEQKLDRILTYTLLGAKSMLTIEDVCLLTGLSRSYLYALTSKKQIPYYRPLGKQIYFSKAEIENWLKRNRVDTAKECEQKAIDYIVTRGS